MKSIIMAGAALILFAACSTQEPSDQAQLLTYNELTNTPGYAWFPAEMSVYNPDPAMVDSVKKFYNASEQKICIFVKPTCACSGTKRLFPRTVKTLQAAGVDLEKVEFWSMRTVTDKQPYQPAITLNGLPTIIVLRNGLQSGRIEESDFSENNADTLIARAIEE